MFRRFNLWARDPSARRSACGSAREPVSQVRSELLSRRVALSLPLALGPFACSGNSPGYAATEPPPPSDVAVFTVVPVSMPEGGTLTPLGHLQPVGHVLPTDHVYFYATNIDRPLETDGAVRNVYAPGDGVVTWMLLIPSQRADWKVMFRMTNTFYYYLDHVLIDPSLRVGSVVRAGDLLGTTHPGGALDLGAYDTTQTLPGLLRPERYPDQTIHCVSPWKYFVEPLRSELYARIRRAPSAADRDGRIDYGIPGRLAGDWFHESVPRDLTSCGPLGWPKSLAFAYDYFDPSAVRVSIGGTVSTPGAWAIPADAIRPESVTPASGPVAYRLLYTGDHTQWGLMVVEMTSDDQIRVQVFPGEQGGSRAFDGAALRYTR